MRDTGDAGGAGVSVFAPWAWQIVPRPGSRRCGVGALVCPECADLAAAAVRVTVGELVEVSRAGGGPGLAAVVCEQCGFSALEAAKLSTVAPIVGVEVLAGPGVSARSEIETEAPSRPYTASGDGGATLTLPGAVARVVEGGP